MKHNVLSEWLTLQQLITACEDSRVPEDVTYKLGIFKVNYI